MINIIIPPVWSGVYINIAKLLKYSLEDMGKEASIIEAGEIQNGDLSILLGWNLVPDEIVLKQPYNIYQLEPLGLPLWQDKLIHKIKLFQRAEKIWDYSESNTRYLNELGLKTEVVPLGYHKKLEEVTFSEFPDYDVLFVGFLTDRRKKIIDELQKHCCVSIQQRWGKDFSEALGRSKILLNIHQYDVPTPLEQPRIAYALNNGCFVLSEESIDKPYKNLVTCSYDSLINETLNYLHHPKLRNVNQIKMLDFFRSYQMKEIVFNALKNINDLNFSGC